MKSRPQQASFTVYQAPRGLNRRSFSTGLGLASKPYKPVYNVNFWSGSYPHTVDPEEIVFDCKGKLPQADEDFKKQVHEVYERKGIVWVRNTGATSLQHLNEHVDLIIEGKTDYKGGANSRGNVEPNFYEVGAPACADLHYHHEMAYVGKPTERLVFSITDVLPGDRGNTYMSDQVGVTDEILETEMGQKLKDKGVCYQRNLTDAAAYKGEDESTVYNHWQTSFMTDDPEEAQAIAEEYGLEVTWGKDWQGKGRYMKTRYYVDAYEYAPMLDRNLIFASIADHHAWFDTWPGIQNLHPADRHLNMTYGDDSDLLQSEWQQWISLNDKYGFPIKYEQGDFVMFCNYRIAHGRPAYEVKEGEKRNLGVVLGASFNRVGQLENKW